MAADAKAKGNGPKLPVVMTANDLLDGEVVFLGREGWSFDPADALIASDIETAERLEAEAAASVKANRNVDAYLVPVEVAADGRWTATHFREAIRQRGPTIHPDMGKQAEFQA